MEQMYGISFKAETPIEIKFFTVQDIMELTHWSKTTVLKLFDDPKFPSSNFGKNQVIEAHALVDYFSRKHVKEKDKHWRA